MSNFSAKISKHEITDIEPRFKAGDTLSENAAVALSRLVIDKVSGNFRADFDEAKKAKNADRLAALETDFKKQVSEYEFGATARALPPLDRIKRKVAADAIKDDLEAKVNAGEDGAQLWKDLSDTEQSGLIDAAIAHEEYGPWITQQAEDELERKRQKANRPQVSLTPAPATEEEGEQEAEDDSPDTPTEAEEEPKIS